MDQYEAAFSEAAAVAAQDERFQDLPEHLSAIYQASSTDGGFANHLQQLYNISRLPADFARALAAATMLSSREEHYAGLQDHLRVVHDASKQSQELRSALYDLFPPGHEAIDATERRQARRVA